MDKICYTAIFGSQPDGTPYDDLKTPVPAAGWRFICFTDQPLTSDVWEIVPTVVIGNDPQRMARRVKILQHEYLPTGWEYSLWLDASFEVRVDLNNLWALMWKTPFSCPAHPIRASVYQEFSSCHANCRGETAQLLEQEQRYKAEGIEHFKGVVTSGVLWRANDATVREFCNAWWTELERSSVRDQISFAYVEQKFGVVAHKYNWDYSVSKELKYFKHIKFRH